MIVHELYGEPSYISTIQKDLVAKWVDTINKTPVNYYYVYISSVQLFTNTNVRKMWLIKRNYNNFNCIWFCKIVNMSIECNFCSLIELWRLWPKCILYEPRQNTDWVHFHYTNYCTLKINDARWLQEWKSATSFYW